MENIRSLHTKNLSNAETNTTALSVSGELPMTLASPSSSGSSTTFFGSASQRRSLGATGGGGGGFKRTPTESQLQSRQVASGGGSLEQQYAYRQAQMQTIQQLSSQRLLAASNSNSNSMAPTYSNMINSSADVMDEFIRQRELNMPSLEQQRTNYDHISFYRSQSARHVLPPVPPLVPDVHSSIYLMEAEDQRHHHQHHHHHQQQHQFYTQHMNRGPPVYPRTHQAASLATHYEQRFVGDARPLVAARTSHRQQQQQILAAAAAAANSSLQQQLHASTLSNRFSMPAFNKYGYDQPASLGFLDTTDSHLNRLPETVAMNNHPDRSQLIAYANAIETNNHYREPHNDDGANHLNQSHQPIEHIYDVNAYATPEQTPLRRANTTNTSTTNNSGQVQSSTPATERPRVSQLIQSFNSKLPE